MFLSNLARSLRSRWPWFCLAAVVFALQQCGNAYTTELNHHPDEPAHFITGLMVYDYLHGAIGTPPLEFAEDYYLHFPKVAFGHWPPAFYFLQAGWFLLTGPSLPAAMALIGLCAMGVAGIVYARLRVAYGQSLALVSAMGLLFLPGVQPELSRFMAELPLTLFCLLAVFAFADFVQERRTVDAVAFAVWSILALLTKGNALALALLVPLTIALVGEFNLLRDWRLWAAGLSVALVCGPVYYLTLGMATNVGSSGGLSNQYLVINLRLLFPTMRSSLGPMILVFAVFGSVSCLIRRYDRKDVTTRTLVGRVSLAWILAVVTLQIILPFAGDPRYFVPAAPAVAILSAECFRRGYEFVHPKSPRLACIVLFAPCGFMALVNFQPAHSGVSGYRSAAQYIPVKEETAVLISSDSTGEGAFIVERRLADVQRTAYVLRASKVLASDSWMNKEYRPVFHSAEECRDYLKETPVEFILVDTIAFRNSPPGHHSLLEETIRTYPDEFPLIKTFPLEKSGRVASRSLQLVHNLTAVGRRVGPIRLDMKRVLGRDIAH